MRSDVIVCIALLFVATCWWVDQRVPNLDERDPGAMPENNKANRVTKEAKDEVIEGGAVADHGARDKARDTAEKEYEDAQQRSRDTHESAKKRMSGRDKTVFEAAKEVESHATGELAARMRDDVDVDEL